MAKYKVDRVDGKWAVLALDGKVMERDIISRKLAREKKKELEGNTVIKARTVVTTKAARPARPATKHASAKQKSKGPVEEVGVANNEKVKGICKANYQGNLRRAKELKAKLTECLDRTGGFPSHRYIINSWGFNMSLKAIIRHKKNLLRDIGREGEKVPTTIELSRKKNKEK